MTVLLDYAYSTPVPPAELAGFHLWRDEAVLMWRSLRSEPERVWARMYGCAKAQWIKAARETSK